MRLCSHRADNVCSPRQAHAAWLLLSSCACVHQKDSYPYRIRVKSSYFATMYLLSSNSPFYNGKASVNAYLRQQPYTLLLLSDCPHESIPYPSKYHAFSLCTTLCESFGYLLLSFIGFAFSRISLIKIFVKPAP